MPERQGTIAGVPVSLESHDAVLAGIGARIAARHPGGVVSITNTESMYHALRDARHLSYIRRAEHSLCDGVGVVVTVRFCHAEALGLAFSGGQACGGFHFGWVG